MLIPGATNPSYTVTQSDSYHVVVTDTNNCIGKSNISSVILNMEDSENRTSISLLPNPNDGLFQVRADVPVTNSEVVLEIWDILGRLVFTSTLTVKNGKIETLINVKREISGAYFLRIISEESIKNLAFLKY